MSSPLNIHVHQSTSKKKHASRDDTTKGKTPPPRRVHELDTPLKSWFAPDQNYPLTLPPATTRCTSHRPSDLSETTILASFFGIGTYDNASSDTIQDEFPWHDVEANKYTQNIPSTIVPALLQNVNDVSPTSRSLLDEAKGGLREVDEDSDSDDDLPRYSAAQKGKWKTGTHDDSVQSSPLVRKAESPEFQFQFQSINNSIDEWVMHNRPILQEYADRQVSLPLSRRLEVSIDEPSESILGALQLLVNRDQNGCMDNSRKLGPQLIENFVDIDHWAKEYFRSRHATLVVDSDISSLLTIVLNNFYEAQVQLIDRLVEFALGHMQFCGRSSLKLEDFVFGFDFKMSQDLPFYVETSSLIREPLSIRAVEVDASCNQEQVKTSSGRQIKPSKRAQEAAEQAQNNVSAKGNKDKKKVKDKKATSDSPPPVRQKTKRKSPVQTSFDDTVPETAPVAAPAHEKYRPGQPSDLGLPPIQPSPSSGPGTAYSPGDDDASSKSRPDGPGTAAESKDASGSTGSNPKTRSSTGLKIKIPAIKSMVSRVSSNSTTIVDRGSLAKVTEVHGAARRPPTRNLVDGCGITAVPVGSSDKTPETTSVNVDVRKAVGGEGDVMASATVTTMGCSTTPLDADGLGDSAGTTSSAGPRGGDNNTTVPLTDPGHSQGKKRKLDDWDE